MFFDEIQNADACSFDCKGVATKAIALRVAALHNYIEQGGMPELLHESNKRKYIDSLMNTIIRNDIAKRFKIWNLTIYIKDGTSGCDFVAAHSSRLAAV